MAELKCKQNENSGMCDTHAGQVFYIIDEHEFAGCLLGAVEYLRELELENEHFQMIISINDTKLRKYEPPERDEEDEECEEERAPVKDDEAAVMNCAGVDNDNASE